MPGGGEKKAFGLNLYRRYDLQPGDHTVIFTKLDGQYFVFDGRRVYEEEQKEPVSKTTLEYFLNKAKEHVAAGDGDGCVDVYKRQLYRSKLRADGRSGVHAAEMHGVWAFAG